MKKIIIILVCFHFYFGAAYSQQKMKDSVITEPMFFDGNEEIGSQLLYHSMLAGYTVGLGSGFSQDGMETSLINKRGRVSARNLSISQLFRLAYGEGRRSFPSNQIVINSVNKRALTPKGSEKDTTWFRDNAYCYELRTPEGLVKETFKLMQRDLALFFPQFKAHVETRSIPVYTLIRTSSYDKIETKNGIPEMRLDGNHAQVRNNYLNILIFELRKYLQHLPFSLVNETNYLKKVDLNINGNLSSIEAINGELEKYDLKFVEAIRDMEILVISDNN